MRLLLRHAAEEDLVALLDGELPLPERTAVERHVAACARCTELLSRHERARQALAAELAREPEPSLPALQWRLRPAATAAGAGVLTASIGALVVAGLLMRRHQRRTTGLRPLPAA